MNSSASVRGFTLIELLTALLILSLLSLMSYRGLGAVLDARAHVMQETGKWQRVAAFSARFAQDLQLMVPSAIHIASGSAPAFVGRSDTAAIPRLEFNRFATVEGVDAPRRVGYALNDRQEIELWLWPGLGMAPDTPPARYPLLGEVTTFEFQYLGADLAWVGSWPAGPGGAAIPRAVRLRIVLASGEEIVRVFALQS